MTHLPRFEFGLDILQQKHVRLLLKKPQSLRREKTAAHGLVGLRPHTETAVPERAASARRAGPHLAPIARAVHALPPHGAQGSPRNIARLGSLRRHRRFAGQGRHPPDPQRALVIRAGAHRSGRCPLAFQAELPNGRYGAASGHAYSAAAPQHFLYFLPLPQGQGSLRPTLGSGRR